MNTRTLYRPVGEKELLLILESEYSKFPPRLDWQPIFYPVLNETYASEIAEQWNTKDAFGNYLGFVTAFDILETEFLKYKVENVGGHHHNELWVPAEALESFNAAIVGAIKVTQCFVGTEFKGSEHPEIVNIINRLKTS